jgi:hypothetical protein
MELYTLDRQLRREDVIDDFESLIWAERWREIGDFELITMSSVKMRSRFTLGRFLAVNNSKRVMVVESIEDGYDEGKTILTIKGRSLEKILDDRVYALDNGAYQVVRFEDTPGNIARAKFHICNLVLSTLQEVCQSLLVSLFGNKSRVLCMMQFERFVLGMI